MKTGAAGRARKLTVGFFAPYGAYGGTERYLDKLMRPVAEMGHRVVFFHPAESPGEWVDEVAEYAETVCYSDGRSNNPNSAAGRPRARTRLLRVARRLHRRFTPRSIRFLLGFARETIRMRDIFRQSSVDVLHFSDLGADPWIPAARLARIPRLTGALGCLPRQESFRRSLTYRSLEALCLRCVDAVAAVSKNGKDLWTRRARLNPRKVKVVYNGIELPDLRNVSETSAEVRRRFGIPLDVRVIGVSASLVPVKAHVCLLAAFPDVVSVVPEARLMLAGDGPSRAELEEQARRLGIWERVNFLGHCKDIKRVVQAYDVIALPSLSESLPFSLLEGMSYGKPVVASAVGGIPELVENGVCGYVVPPCDVPAIARALIELLGDPRKAHRMGMAARERVRTQFSVEKMVRETMAVMFDSFPDGRRIVLTDGT